MPVTTVFFDRRIASSYQAKWPELFTPAAVDPVVDFLAGLAGDGAALELGIGTGRIALPSPAGASACTASTCRRTWWPSSGPGRARRPSA